MRLVICKACGRLSRLFEKPVNIFACACADEDFLRFSLTYDYRELDEHEQSALDSYVREKKDPPAREPAGES